MAERILNQKRFDKLIEKLEAFPIDKWKRKEENKDYDPAPNDDMGISSRTRIVSYLTESDLFGFVVERKYYSRDYKSEISYLLKVCSEEDNEPLFSAEEMRNPSEKKRKGKVQRFYEKLEDQFKKYTEYLGKEQEAEIQRKLNDFLEGMPN